MVASPGIVLDDELALDREGRTRSARRGQYHLVSACDDITCGVNARHGGLAVLIDPDGAALGVITRQLPGKITPKSPWWPHEHGRPRKRTTIGKDDPIQAGFAFQPNNGLLSQTDVMSIQEGLLLASESSWAI
jgi:hypothetical protein